MLEFIYLTDTNYWCHTGSKKEKQRKAEKQENIRKVRAKEREMNVVAVLSLSWISLRRFMIAEESVICIAKDKAKFLR